MVTRMPSPEALKRAMCDLTLVEVADGGLLVALPQIYSSGEVVSVEIRAEPDGFLVHDAGGGAMALESRGFTISPRVQEQFRERLKGYDCDFQQFRVIQNCDDADRLAATAAVVGCASRLVADFVLDLEPAPLTGFRRELVARRRALLPP